MPARVTIGMPVYNGADLLDGALDSLLAQSYEDFELVISDNASTDSTGEVCRRWAAKDRRISYMRQERNIGAVRNFHAVLDAASSPYFFWSAHDDLWEPGFLAALVAQLEGAADAVFACCDYDVHVHGTGERVSHAAASLPRLEPGSGRAVTAERLIGSPQPVFVYGLFRTSLLQSARAMDAGEFDFNDLALLVEVALAGEIRFVPEVLFHAGVKQEVRVPRSLAKRRLRGLKLSYGPYTRHTLGVIARAPGLTLRERARLSRSVVRQVITLARWHEWGSGRVQSGM